MDLIKESLFKAAGVTVLVLTIGLLIGLQLDDARTSYIDSQISDAQVNAETVVAVQNYLESSDSYCRLVSEEIPDMGRKNAEIGTTLQQFSSKGVSEEREYKTLRRKYYVSQLRLYNTMMSYQKRCDSDIDVIMFFFDSGISSQRQGAVLTEYRREVDNSTNIFSYNLAVDDSQVLEVLKTDYNITDGPSIVVNGNQTHRDYVPLKELEQILQEEQETVNATESE
jgi:predicted transcriptional regulator